MNFPKQSSERSIARFGICGWTCWAKRKLQSAAPKTESAHRSRCTNKERRRFPNRCAPGGPQRNSEKVRRNRSETGRTVSAKSASNADLGQDFFCGALAAFGCAFHVAIELLAGVFAG